MQPSEAAVPAPRSLAWQLRNIRRDRARIRPLLIAQRSILTSPLTEGLLSKLTGWSLAGLQLLIGDCERRGRGEEEEEEETRTLKVQQVYSGVGTARVREDEPPELIRDYNRPNPPPPSWGKVLEGL